MKNIYQKNYSVLTNLFLDSYFNEYKSFKQKNKRHLLPYIPINYRKWFYSSFIEETILTPHTIFDRLNNSDQSDSFIMPSLRYENFRKEGFYFKDVIYSLNEHPMATDLLTFLSMCQPDLSLTDNDCMLPADLERFAQEMNIQDSVYVEYLFELAVHMKLLNKIPSIYSNKSQVTDAAASFKEMSLREILDKVFNAALELAAAKLKIALPKTVSGFTKSYFLTLLKKPKPIDMIFQHVYSSLGLDINHFMTQFDEYEGPEPDQAYAELGDMLMSSTYMLGMLIDKYFLTPMGFYMHFIMPIYYLPFNFADELIFLYETLKSDIMFDSGMWSPCSNFFLTDLGLKYLKVKKNSRNYLRLPDTMPIEDLLSNITLAIRTEKLIKAKQQAPVAAKSVFEIKARLRVNKNIWFSFEMEESDTLNDVHDMICDMFLLDYDADYSISVGDNPSPFMTYVSPLSSSRYKKANTAALLDLNLSPKQKLTYRMPNTLSSLSWAYPFIEKDLYVELEVILLRSANPRLLYPQIIRKGKLFEKWEEEFEY